MNLLRTSTFIALAVLLAACSPESATPPNQEALAEATRLFEEPTRLWQAQFDELTVRGEHIESPIPDRQKALVMSLPLTPREPVQLRTGDGWSMEVWDDARVGRAELVGRTVVMPREGGSSFWSARDGSIEEWLYFPEGVSQREVARYRIRGGDVRQHGSSLDVYDDAGKPRVTVAAPAVYASDGQRIDARMELQGGDAVVVLSAVSRGPLLVDPVFVPAGDMTKDRMAHRAVPLLSGKIFVVGGRTQFNGVAAALAVTDIFDPTTSTWMSGPVAAGTREGCSATTLEDGRVLVVDSLPVGARTEIFDETTGTWSTPAQSIHPRGGQGSAKLPDGRVLVAGGIYFSDTAEIYDPVADTWTNTAPLATDHSTARLLLLPSGDPIILLGSFPEIYSVVGDTWTAKSPPPAGYGLPTPLLLSNSTILFTATSATYNQVATFDWAADIWTILAPLQVKRSGGEALMTTGGEVMVVGGYDPIGSIPYASTELLDADLGGWTYGPTMTQVRVLPTVTELADGRILVAGGYDLNKSLNASELLSIDGALGSPCAHPSECASLQCADGVCCDAPCLGACMACSAAAGGSQDGTCGPSTGEACDDGNLCTEGDICQAGACVATAKSCPSTVCAVGSCDVSMGCILRNLPDGTQCFSGHCIGGSCTGLASSAASGGAGGVGGEGGASRASGAGGVGAGGSGGDGGIASTTTATSSTQTGTGGTSTGALNDDTIAPAGGGCGVASGSSARSTVYIFLLGVAIEAYRRRRRRHNWGDRNAESCCSN